MGADHHRVPADRGGMNRRTFLGAAAGSAATLAAATYAGSAEGSGEKDELRIGIIGCGGRARRRLMPALKKIKGTRIVAVCDVYTEHLKAGQHIAGGEAFETADHHALIDRDDVDAVLIATPDHWHVPITVEACEAGKDVYVEKPLTHDPEEGAAVIAAQNENERIVQVGMQQRSMPQFHDARKMIAEGKIGRVFKVRMSWNRNFLPFNKPEYNYDPARIDWQRWLGNAPDQPFDPFRFAQWRWFWDFGGGILTDLMVHWLDAVNFVLGYENDAPNARAKRIATVGRHFATEGIWQTPDTIQTMLDYANVQMYFDGTFVNDHNHASVDIMAEDATLYLDRGRWELHPQPYRDMNPAKRVIGSGKRARDFYDKPDGEILHLTDWLESVRSRNTPNAPAEAGVLAAEIAHQANRAYREDRVVHP